MVGVLKQCGRPLVAPMTVVNENYSTNMGGLRDASVDVRHFTLLASATTLRGRLLRQWSLPSSTRWALARIERTTAALSSPNFAIHITTDDQTVQDVVNDLRSCLADIRL